MFWSVAWLLHYGVPRGAAAKGAMSRPNSRRLFSGPMFAVRPESQGTDHAASAGR